MAQLDTTIVTVALPSIQVALGAAPTLAEWVMLGYVVPLLALTLLSGRWVGSVGVSRGLTGGCAGFAAASVAAGLAPDAAVLIAARVLQGAAAALLLAAAPVAATEAVDEAKRGRALGVVSTLAPLAPLGAVSGPVLGGLLVDSAGWR